MKKVLFTSLLLIALSTLCFGQSDKQYRETLQKMLKVSNVEGGYRASLNPMITMFKQQYPDDDEFWKEFEKELSVSLEELLELLVPVYKKYLTIEDLKGMIKFYETPVGRKYAQKSPLIVQESMQVGQQWGMKMGKKIKEKIKQREELLKQREELSR